MVVVVSTLELCILYIFISYLEEFKTSRSLRWLQLCSGGWLTKKSSLVDMDTASLYLHGWLGTIPTIESLHPSISFFSSNNSSWRNDESNNKIVKEYEKITVIGMVFNIRRWELWWVLLLLSIMMIMKQKEEMMCSAEVGYWWRGRKCEASLRFLTVPEEENTFFFSLKSSSWGVTWNGIRSQNMSEKCTHSQKEKMCNCSRQCN